MSNSQQPLTILMEVDQVLEQIEVLEQNLKNKQEKIEQEQLERKEELERLKLEIFQENNRIRRNKIFHRRVLIWKQKEDKYRQIVGEYVNQSLNEFFEGGGFKSFVAQFLQSLEKSDKKGEKYQVFASSEAVKFLPKGIKFTQEKDKKEDVLRIFLPQKQISYYLDPAKLREKMKTLALRENLPLLNIDLIKDEKNREESEDLEDNLNNLGFEEITEEIKAGLQTPEEEKFGEFSHAKVAKTDQEFQQQTEEEEFKFTRVEMSEEELKPTLVEEVELFAPLEDHLATVEEKVDPEDLDEVKSKIAKSSRQKQFSFE